MRSLRSEFIGSMSAWLPSRRSTAHQRGACSMRLVGHVRSGSSNGICSWNGTYFWNGMPDVCWGWIIASLSRLRFARCPAGHGKLRDEEGRGQASSRQRRRRLTARTPFTVCRSLGFASTPRDRCPNPETSACRAGGSGSARRPRAGLTSCSAGPSSAGRPHGRRRSAPRAAGARSGRPRGPRARGRAPPSRTSSPPSSRV